MANLEKNAASKSTSTFIPMIDEGHSKLAEIHARVKSLIKKDACQSDLADIFFALSYFFEDHLIKEELFLKAKGYPILDEHKASHDDFIKGIEHLKDNYSKDAVSILSELDSFIGDWLRNHTERYNQSVNELLNQRK